jgi:hypothetical protein
MPTALNALAGVAAGAVILGLVGVAKGFRTLLGRRG